MTLDKDIANSLPSALHDAALHALHLDYRNRRAVLTVDVCVGAPDAEREEDRERRRPAEVILSGLVFAIVEAPNPDNHLGAARPLRIDMTDLPEDEALRLPPVPEGASAFRLFVSDWNSFITFAAGDVALHWLDGV